jgi:hypothetical protein
VRVTVASVGLGLALAASAAMAATAAVWSQERAIVTAEAAQRSWIWLYHAGETAWTPAQDDVLALEKALPDHLRTELTRQRTQARSKVPLWERAPTYKRQYAGVRRNGRRIVHANFFCRDYGKNWRTEPIVVKDGGDRYFNIDYDVEKKTFANLSINGEA